MLGRIYFTHFLNSAFLILSVHLFNVIVFFLSLIFHGIRAVDPCSPWLLLFLIPKHKHPSFFCQTSQTMLQWNLITRITWCGNSKLRESLMLTYFLIILKTLFHALPSFFLVRMEQKHKKLIPVMCNGNQGTRRCSPCSAPRSHHQPSLW